MKASDYKKLASKARVTYEVELPSGAVFKLADPPVQQWVMAGRLPTGLMAKMVAVAKGIEGKSSEAAAEAALKAMTEEEFVLQLTLGRELLLATVIEPRLSAEGDADSVALTDILPDDYTFLMKWIWSGGKQGGSLDTFRSE